MQLSDFHYDLPLDRIAQSQAIPRDSAKLLLLNRKTNSVSHHHVYDLPALIPANYCIVANNTKVFPARLPGHKSTGGKVEILLIKPIGHSSYRCITRPGLKVGDQLTFGSLPDILSGIISDSSGIERTIHFNQEESLLRTTLSQLGTMPTPPYIKKLLGNSTDYQTIYAKYGFSAAAPTAGLHFTSQLLNKIKAKYSWNELTLNVGLGTFLPVKENNIEEHHMHSESYTISNTAANNLNQAKSKQQKILSIGTTTMRALESNVTLNGTLTPGSFSTDIYIYPPYQFATVDALMTNFHLPNSTLLMLVSAFCTSPNSKEKFVSFKDSLLGHAYQEAIDHDYRFFSFGDAMLII